MNMIIKKRTKCNCWTKQKKRCNKTLFIILKVQVFHPNSNRRAWQTWYLCREHFLSLESVEGKGWGCFYKSGERPFAPLIQYKIK